jgi:hypothetical protein
MHNRIQVILFWQLRSRCPIVSGKKDQPYAHKRNEDPFHGGQIGTKGPILHAR